MEHGICATVLAGLVLTTGSVPAQAQTVRPGIEVGVSAVSLAYDAGPPFYEKILIPEWDSRPRVSSSLMAFLDVRLSQQLTLQSGLRLAQAGDKASRSESGIDFAYEKRQLYLAVPVRLRVRIHGSRFFAIAGPEFGYLLRAASTRESSFLNPGHPATDEAFSTYLKQYNVAVGAGFGVFISGPGKQFYLEIDYIHGITGNIDHPEKQGFAVRRIGGYDWRTRETVLKLGYVF